MEYTINGDTLQGIADAIREMNGESDPIAVSEFANKIRGLGNGSKPVKSEVTILASKWVGESSPYSQVVEIEGVTENSQVDLTLSAEQVNIFLDKQLAFVTENEDGVVTVYAIGQKPENDYTIQVTITEVAV